MKKSIVLNLVALFAVITANATTHLVPGQYSTIQAALNDCQATDTVLVNDGVYFGTLNWPKVNRIVLKSVSGKEATFLDGGFTGSVLILNSAANKLTAT